MYWRIGLIVACLVVSGTGCNSIKTTFLKNDSQGNLCKETHCRQGVPVMVKVPTHVDVIINQTDVWKQVPKNGVNPEKYVPVPEATSRTHEVIPVSTDQMFLLDPKRPAAGLGQFKFTFGSAAKGGANDAGKGLLSAVGYKTEDETLSQSANLGLNLATALLTDAGATKSDDSSNLLKMKKVIAYKRFPVGDDLESRIQDFLDEYITNCADYSCSQPPSYAR